MSTNTAPITTIPIVFSFPVPIQIIFIVSGLQGGVKSKGCLLYTSLLFSDDYNHLSPAQMREVLAANVHSANIPCMVVTMGGQGAVYRCV